MKQQKKVLLFVNAGTGWMGGVYFVKNFLSTMLLNQDVKTWKIYILCPDEHREIFASFSGNPNIHIFRRFNFVHKINYALMKVFRLVKKDFPIDVALAGIFNKVDGIFPVAGYPIAFLEKKCIHWIPDFQHLKMPEFFSPKERRQKDTRFDAIGMSKGTVVLNSLDAEKHYKMYFPHARAKALVIPFVSDIEDWISDGILSNRESDLKEYGLVDSCGVVPYIYVANQFWVHKNHEVAFRGFAEYRRKHPDSKLMLVCTGSSNEYRVSGYFDSLMAVLKSLNISEYIKILSFVGRRQQMIILQNCNFLLQPSLFEGWGTSVQEAKRLGKPKKLSDTNIHMELIDDRTVYFETNSPESLAEAINVQ